MRVKFQTNMSVLGLGKYKITDYIKHFDNLNLRYHLMVEIRQMNILGVEQIGKM